MENKRFRNVDTGKVWTCRDYGKMIFEETWKEQKAAGSIPEESEDFNRPSILSDTHYIEIGFDNLCENEEYEEI